MTPEQFTQAQVTLGFDNADMGKELGLSERMVRYMRTGEKKVSERTSKRMKEAIKRKIDDLKVLQRFLK